MQTKTDLINRLKDLIPVAIMVEFSTLPPYLTAYWTIFGESKNANQTKEILLSVIQEEMLHFAMACNLLHSIGGQAKVNDKSKLPNYPTSLPGYSASNSPFLVHLNKCCPASFANFIQIERPEDDDETECPIDGWRTIGQFYSILIALINDPKLEDKDFQHGRQIASNFNPAAGELIEINSKDDAIKAINEIIDQGEGSQKNLFDKDHKLTHFWRFRAAREMMMNGDWDFDKEILNVGKDPNEENFTPEAKEINKKFNLEYTKMMDQMQEALEQENPDFGASIGTMMALKPIAVQIMNIPLKGGQFNSSPTFKYLN